MNAPMRATSIRVVVLLALAAAGCDYGAYFVRDAPVPVRGLTWHMDPHVRKDCLVVFMPGMLDTPDDFVEHGFFEDGARASRRCDFVAVDAHLAYYRDGTVRRRVSQDVIQIAEARGYRDIWIVGISMGGMGALLVSQVNADRIRGIVLFAPFLGDPGLVESIREDGGLAEWDAPADLDLYDANEYDDALWAWLQGYATDPDSRPPLWIGVGDEDRMRPGVAMLGEVLPAGRTGGAEGGHNWFVWRELWQQLLVSPPWDPRDTAPGWARAPAPVTAQDTEQ